jgi:hypothetical protein
MPKKRHSPEQIVGKLRDADAMLSAGKTIGLACQSLEISKRTFHRWQSHYGCIKPKALSATETKSQWHSTYNGN